MGARILLHLRHCLLLTGHVVDKPVIDIDGCGFASNLLQVIGWADGDVTLSEKEREEIVRLLKSRCRLNFNR